jgi:anthranilate synthase component 2
MRIFLLDNYDSFTYNLVHVFASLTGEAVTVQLNDEVDFDQVAQHDRIVLSPGPGLPAQAGKMRELIERFSLTHPMFGICLGHQALAEHFGAKLVNLPAVHHGVSHAISHEDNRLFKGLPSTLEVGRYHSWVVGEDSFPSVLKVTARDQAGVIMAFKHQNLDICGVQFHPESVLTPQGKAILSNWLSS